MDFKNNLELLAKSLNLLGLSVSPKSWTLSQNGPEITLNIKFVNNSSAMDFQTTKGYRRKSPSTIKRGQERKQRFREKIRISAQNADYPASNSSPGDAAVLAGTTASSLQHLETSNSDTDNMDKPHTSLTDGNQDELCELNSTPVLPFNDCDNNELLDAVNPGNFLLDDLKQTKHKLQIMKKLLKTQEKSNSTDICVSSQDPSSSLSSKQQETLNVLMDIAKKELASQIKIRELSEELSAAKKAQQDAEDRAMRTDDELQRLRRRYEMDNDKRLHDHGKYDFHTQRTVKHQSDHRQQDRYNDDYGYRYDNQRHEYRPNKDKYYRKY